MIKEKTHSKISKTTDEIPKLELYNESFAEFPAKLSCRYYIYEDGCYYPNLVLKEQVGTYGKYGRMRKRYLQEHRTALFTNLLLSEKLHDELVSVDVKANALVERLVAEMAAKEGTDSALKMRDQMRWVGLMNNYKHCAEEIAMETYIYA